MTQQQQQDQQKQQQQKQPQKQIRVKAKIFEGEHARRFSVGSFQDMVEKLNQYNNTPTVEFDICYRDEDGDWVIVEDFNEWEEMLRQHPEGKVLNIELRRKASPMRDYMQKQAENVRENVSQKAAQCKKQWAEQRQAFNKQKEKVKESEQYKKTKEKMQNTFEGIHKTFEQLAETGKDAVNELVDYFTTMMDEHAQPSSTKKSYKVPMPTPYAQQQQQQQQQTQTQEEEEEEKVETPQEQRELYEDEEDVDQEDQEPLIEFELPEPITPHSAEEKVQNPEIFNVIEEQEQEVDEEAEAQTPLMVEAEEAKEDEEAGPFELLEQMGFPNRELNEKLYKKYNKNISRVVSELLAQ